MDEGGELNPTDLDNGLKENGEYKDNAEEINNSREALERALDAVKNAGDEAAAKTAAEALDQARGRLAEAIRKREEITNEFRIKKLGEYIKKAKNNELSKNAGKTAKNYVKGTLSKINELLQDKFPDGIPDSLKDFPNLTDGDTSVKDLFKKAGIKDDQDFADFLSEFGNLKGKDLKPISDATTGLMKNALGKLGIGMQGVEGIDPETGEITDQNAFKKNYTNNAPILARFSHFLDGIDSPDSGTTTLRDNINKTLESMTAKDEEAISKNWKAMEDAFSKIRSKLYRKIRNMVGYRSPVNFDVDSYIENFEKSSAFKKMKSGADWDEGAWEKTKDKLRNEDSTFKNRIETANEALERQAESLDEKYGGGYRFAGRLLANTLALLTILGTIGMTIAEFFIMFKAGSEMSHMIDELSVNASGCFLIQGNTKGGNVSKKRLIIAPGDGSLNCKESTVTSTNYGEQVQFYELGGTPVGGFNVPSLDININAGNMNYPLAQYCGCIPDSSSDDSESFSKSDDRKTFCESKKVKGTSFVYYPECLMNNIPITASNLNITTDDDCFKNDKKLNPSTTESLPRCKSGTTDGEIIQYQFINQSGIGALTAPFTNILNQGGSGLFSSIKTVIIVVVAIGLGILVLKLLSGIHKKTVSAQQAASAYGYGSQSGSSKFNFKMNGNKQCFAKMLHTIDHWTLVPLLNNIC